MPINSPLDDQQANVTEELLPVETAVDQDATEEQLTSDDLVPVQSGMRRRDFVAALAGLGLAGATGLPEEAGADETVKVATNNVSKKEERDIDELMKENPGIKDKNAAQAYFDGIDGIRPGESIEEYEKRKARYVRAWDEYTPSLAKNTSDDEPTEYMLFRRKVTKTVNGKKHNLWLYVGIGIREGLHGTKYDGLSYAETLGYAQTTEQAKKLHDKFLYGVVAKYK